MRKSRYGRKLIELDKKTLKYIIGACAAALLAAVIFVSAYFHVDTVEVVGSDHYTEDEIKEKILRGPLASNSLLAPLLYSSSEINDITYIKSAKVTRTDRNTLTISVKEESAVGCLPYLDSYIYFDRNGVFVDASQTRDESVPFFDGIVVENVVLKEELPIKDTVLNTAVALSTIFAKNDMTPDHIEFDDSNEISLIYGDITVKLGKDQYLEDKMIRAIAILPQISGKKGILHMENVTESVKTVTFESDEDIVVEEEWKGGYDENGEYVGDEGEYDEEGNYVGPKPADSSDTSSDGEDSEEDSEDSDSYEESSDDYSEDSYDDGSYDEYSEDSYDDSYYEDYSEDSYDDSYYDDGSYEDYSGEY